MNEQPSTTQVGTPASDDYDLLAERLRALSHPMRLRVLVRLARQERCPCGEIVRELPRAQSTISQHLKVLVEAGLLRCAPEGARTHYQVDRDAVAALRAETDALFDILLASQADDGR